MKTKVVKRDGSLEDYDEAKIARVAEAAGLESGQAQVVAVNITKWLKENSILKVTSLQIRDQLLEDLKKFDGKAADLFVWYEQTKDGH